MSKQKKIKILYKKVHLFNAKILEEMICLEENIYKSDNCNLILETNRTFREEFKTIMGKSPMRGFENLLFTVLNSHKVYNITLYKNSAVQSLIWKKEEIKNFFNDELSNRIANSEEKEELLVEYKEVIDAISKLKDKEYRVHRQTGKTTRANIKDENYHDVVKRMTIKVKSGLILPIDAKVIIEKNRTRKIRTDKLEILHHLSLQDKSLYLMKNR